MDVIEVLGQGRPAERLADPAEDTGWLATTRRDGRPQSSPVWFAWDGARLWLGSQAEAGKVANVRANPKVAFHLRDDHGGDVVTIEADVEIVDEWPEDVRAGYLAKYDTRIRQGLASTPEQLLVDYPTVLRLTPTRARAW